MNRRASTTAVRRASFATPTRLGALAASVFFAGASSSPGQARAFDLPAVGGEPITVDVTNTAAFTYHFDNRNDPVPDEAGVPPAAGRRVQAGDRVDDDYGELIEHLNLQVGWWRFSLGVRYDAIGYVGATSLLEAGRDAVEVGKRCPPNAAQDELFPPCVATFDEYYRELNNRYRSTAYPAKLWLGYTQPGVEATVGDFYAQLGRGLVLSVRKVDELATDTTIRGGKLVLDKDFGGARLGATLLAGQMNPLRVDEPTGRMLGGTGSPLFFGFPKNKALHTYGLNAEENSLVRVDEPARPSYLEDSVYGLHLEGGGEAVLLGANGLLLVRKDASAENEACLERCAPADTACPARCAATFPNPSTNNTSRMHSSIRTISASASLPSIARHGDFYVEIARQQLGDGRATVVEDGEVTSRLESNTGFAVYANGSVRGGPVTLTLEGKHYRRFFPLSANIDTGSKGFGAPEFNLISYNSPPTAEPIFVEPIGSPQVCNTGGWARVDYRFSPRVAANAWVGHYTSFSELDAVNNDCKTDDEKRTDAWDVAAGGDVRFDEGKSPMRVTLGVREDTPAVPFNGAGGEDLKVFYRETYVRYDLTKHLAGPVSVQVQGFHRRRYEPQTEAEPWLEGENYTAIHVAPHLAGIFGYEYQTRPGCIPADPDRSVCHYVNGGLQYKSGASDHAWQKILDTVTLFVGQRRGAIRCVSGACRFFPPFEGARLELVSRF